MFLKLLAHKIEKEHFHSFYINNNTLIPKPDKDTVGGKSCRPVFLMNTDAEILGKIFADQIQEHIETSHTMIKLVSF